MISLKAFGPVLADTLGTTPAAVYERQRALIRQGLLPAPVGRGRGNGLPATAETVAMIIIAMMVTDNLSDTDERVRKLARARFRCNIRDGDRLPDPRCGLTGKRDFRSALVTLLTITEFPERLYVMVSRNYLSARVIWLKDKATTISEFGRWTAFASNLEIEASLKEGTLQLIGAALRQAGDEHLKGNRPGSRRAEFHTSIGEP
jgi:hypothetical protein